MTNFRNVLKAYTLLRSLNDDETALLETLRGLSDTERELTVAALSPATSKKSTKKAATKSGSKSRRAASLAAATSGALRGTTNGKCFYDMDGETCNAKEDDPIHDSTMGYRAYHEFQPSVITTAKDDNYQEQAVATTTGD